MAAFVTSEDAGLLRQGLEEAFGYPNGKPVGGDGKRATCRGDTTMSHEDQVRRVVHRKVTVKGSGGVSAMVVVTAQRGKVWVSIEPPFIWEAIMEPEKVDELIRTLGQAGDDAKRRVSSKSVSRGDTQPVGSGTVGNTSPHQEP